MPRVVILYDTTEGQTAMIAKRMGEAFAKAGQAITVAEARALPDGFQLASFDGVILGASSHVGKHSPAAVRFVKQNRDPLSGIPSAFFSVSLSAAAKTERQQQNAQRCLDTFLHDTDWTPALTRTFAGALRYRDYGLLNRIAFPFDRQIFLLDFPTKVPASSAAR